jgi:hypothetical protein
MGLRAAQAHLGQLKDSGDPRGWDGTGALTPITRYAEMFSGWGLQNRDGTAWYHSQRLTIDSGAVAEGNANDTESILDVHATHGHDLPKQLRMYAFGAALGDSASSTARRSSLISPASRTTSSSWSTARPTTRTTIRQARARTTSSSRTSRRSSTRSGESRPARVQLLPRAGDGSEFCL